MNPKYIAYILAGLIAGLWLGHAYFSHSHPSPDDRLYVEILGQRVFTVVGTFEYSDSVYVDAQTGLHITPADLFEAVKNEDLSLVPLPEAPTVGIYQLLAEHLTEIIIATISCSAPIVVNRFIQKKRTSQ